MVKKKDSEKLKKFFEALEKNKLKGAIAFANNYAPQKRVKSGIFALDLALGGGIPIGHKILFYGKKSVGKSTIVMKYLAGFLEQGMTALWIDTEGMLNISRGVVSNDSFVKWAKINGVNLDNLVLYSPDTVELATDIMIEGMRTGSFDVIIIDSLAMFEPTPEKEASALKDFQALQARAVGKMWRKIISEEVECANKGKIVTFMMTNQIRYKLGVLYGNPETKPSGVSTDFITSIEVELRSKGYDDAKKKEILEVPRWLDISFITTKNKTYPANIYGEFKLIQKDFGKFKVGNIKDHDIVLNYLVSNNLIQVNEDGSLKFGDIDFADGNDLVKYWEDNPDKYMEFKKSLIDTIIQKGDVNEQSSQEN